MKHCRKCRFSGVCYPLFDSDDWIEMRKTDENEVYSRIAENCDEFKNAG